MFEPSRLTIVCESMEVTHQVESCMYVFKQGSLG